MLQIRRAEATDASLIADLSRQTFLETFAAQNSKDNMEKFMREQFSREKLMAEVMDQTNDFYIAWEEQEPAGYLKLRKGEPIPELGDSPAIEIARIYVSSRHIGKGVGQQLMQKAIDNAIVERIPTIWLGVWEKNERAIQFYTRWGFKKFSTHVFMLGDDPQTDWLMYRPVESDSVTRSGSN
ncbi:MAG TPA: GNAT family N-acetyltransferase [Chitinophagaceae bacterium]|nr:GNAT family N-acetyltransferase [Chitinophagaceae bacterium]